jgi:hypothetical protein
MNHVNNICSACGCFQKEKELTQRIIDLEDHLKRYTNGNNHKRYYDKNRDKIIENGAKYLKKMKEDNPEKLREYRRAYYLKRKDRLAEAAALHT